MQINVIAVKAPTGIIAQMSQRKSRILGFNSQKQFPPHLLFRSFGFNRECSLLSITQAIMQVLSNWQPWILVFWSPGGLQGPSLMPSPARLPTLKLEVIPSIGEAALHNSCSAWTSELERQSFQSKMQFASRSSKFYCRLFLKSSTDSICKTRINFL